MKCLCGCGQNVTPGCRYIKCHHAQSLISVAARIKEMRRILSDPSRFKLRERDYEMSLREIADEMGLTVQAVDQHCLSGMHKTMLQFIGRDLEGII